MPKRDYVELIVGKNGDEVLKTWALIQTMARRDTESLTLTIGIRSGLECHLRTPFGRRHWTSSTLRELDYSIYKLPFIPDRLLPASWQTIEPYDDAVDYGRVSLHEIFSAAGFVYADARSASNGRRTTGRSV